MTYLQTGYAERIYVACGLIFAALIFDILDGRIARWRQKSSAMGRELDSLADVISFGVAPAVMAYACGMQGLYDRAILVFFVAMRAAMTFCCAGPDIRRMPIEPSAAELVARIYCRTCGRSVRSTPHGCRRRRSPNATGGACTA